MTPLGARALLPFVVFGALAFAGAAVASDFRGSEWGATREAVKAHETLVLVSESESEIVYGATIGKMAGEVRYRFGKSGLFETLIVSKEAYDDPLLHIGDYVRLHEILTRAHGDALTDATSFRDEKFRGDVDSWPEALRRGDMVMEAKWIRPRSTIVLRLGGTDGVVSLSADFLSATVKEGEAQ